MIEAIEHPTESIVACSGIRSCSRPHNRCSDGWWIELRPDARIEIAPDRRAEVRA